MAKDLAAREQSLASLALLARSRVPKSSSENDANQGGNSSPTARLRERAVGVDCRRRLLVTERQAARNWGEFLECLSALACRSTEILFKVCTWHAIFRQLLPATNCCARQHVGGLTETTLLLLCARVEQLSNFIARVSHPVIADLNITPRPRYQSSERATRTRKPAHPLRPRPLFLSLSFSLWVSKREPPDARASELIRVNAIESRE